MAGKRQRLRAWLARLGRDKASRCCSSCHVLSHRSERAARRTLKRAGVPLFTACEVAALNDGSCEGDSAGYGYFGFCMKGLDPRTGEEVVIKTFRHGTQFLVQEATVLWELRHVRGMQQLRGVCVKTRELISLYAGVTLQTYFSMRRPSATTAISVFLQVARTLQRVSLAGYAHNDIKSDNVCARKSKGREALRVTVIDVGVAYPAKLSKKEWPKWYDRHERAAPEVQHGIGRCGEPDDVIGIGVLMDDLLWRGGYRDSMPRVEACALDALVLDTCLAGVVRVLRRALKEEEEGDGSGDSLEFH